MSISQQLRDACQGHPADIIHWPHHTLVHAAADRIERLEAALASIKRHYGNQDMNHVDFRVFAMRVADDAL